MSIISPLPLLLLLPLLLVAFYAVGRRGGEKGALFVLLFASVVFAQSQGWWFFGLFLVSLVLNLRIAQALTDGKAGSRALAFGIVVNLAALAVFKYADVLKVVPGGLPLALLLGSLIPITISFVTFQRIAALVDARANREALSGRRGALRFATFASFFPNLLIGPIAYLQEVLPQFRRSDFGRLRKINLAVGLSLIAIGIFKKAGIADPLGEVFVDPVWQRVLDGRNFTSLDAVHAMAGYFLQLYFDFSGYSDIAIGIARLFGIILPINFYSPFRSVGIVDFYRRWHITLTRIIARFLFTPLSIAGTRFAARRRLRGVAMKALSLWIPLVVNFSIIGIWHGATKTFFLFGLIHGIWYAAESEVRSRKGWKAFAKRTPDWQRAWAGRMIALPLLVLTFPLFRAPHLDAMMDFMATFAQPMRLWFLAISPAPADYFVLATGALIAAFLPNTQEFLRRYRPGIVTYRVDSYTPHALRLLWRPTARWAFVLAIIAAFGLYALPRAGAFSYGVF